MKEIRLIDGRMLGFRTAYRQSAIDLAKSRGIDAPDASEPDEWYLDNRARILALTPGDEIEGFVIFSETSFFYRDTNSEILDIWVKEAKRRMGHATRLALAAFEYMHGRIGMQVHRENLASLRFWQEFANRNGLDLSREESDPGGLKAWRLIITKKEPNQTAFVPDEHGTGGLSESS